MAGEGCVAGQIAADLGISEQQVRNIAARGDVKLPESDIGKTRRLQVRRIVEETVNGLEGYAIGLKVVNESGLEFDGQEAAALVESLAESMKAFMKLKRKLAEVSP